MMDARTKINASSKNRINITNIRCTKSNTKDEKKYQNKLKEPNKPSIPGFKITLLDLCEDRQEKHTDVVVEEDVVEQPETKATSFVAPEERCFMPKREESHGDAYCDAVSAEFKLADDWTEDGEEYEDEYEDEYDEECVEYEEGEADGEVECVYCEFCEVPLCDEDEESDEWEICEVYEDDEEVIDEIEQDDVDEFEDLVNGCFSVDRCKLGEIYDKYLSYEDMDHVDLEREELTYGDEQAQCYCHSYEGKPWADLLQELQEEYYQALYGDISCMSDVNPGALAAQEYTEAGLRKNWCLCCPDKSTCRPRDIHAGGDACEKYTTETEDSPIYFNQGDGKSRKNSKPRFKRTCTISIPSHEGMKCFPSYRVEGENINCNNTYNNDGDAGEGGDPDPGKSFYDEDVDELFIIDAPSQPSQPDVMHGRESGDDLYFQTKDDESDKWYQPGQGTMPETKVDLSKGEQPFMTSEQEAIVDKVNQILNLDHDLPKPGGFAYRGPLGHRDEELKVELMSYQHSSYDEEEDNLNNEEIEFDNDTDDESSEDYESEYSDDDEINDDDDKNNKDTTEPETDNVTSSASVCEEMRKGVDECLMSNNESPLIAKNTSALCGISFHSIDSSDSSDNEEDGQGAFDMAENDSEDDDCELEGSQGDAVTEEDDDTQEQGCGEQIEEEEEDVESPVLQQSTSKVSHKSSSDLQHDSEKRKPSLLNEDQPSTWNNVQQHVSLSHSPKPCAVTSYQYQQGDVTDSVDVSPPPADRGPATFSFKPPASGDSCFQEKPSYVLSPKARKHIMDKRYGRKTPPPGPRGTRSKSPTLSRSRSDSKASVKDSRGMSINFMPIVTHEEREMAEAVSKEANIRSTKPRPQMAYLDELKHQTKNIKRKPSPMNKMQTPINSDIERSNDETTKSANQDGDKQIANTWAQPVKMAPKGFKDGTNVSSAIGKRVLVPKIHGYTMQKKKDSGPDPEMSERREQLRQKRREQMAKLSSTAKEKSKPPTYNLSSPFSHSDDLECSSGAEMMPARQKDGYRKTGTRANESHWSPEKRGAKDYKKYGGAEVSDDSPFSHLFDKKTKKPRKTTFANEKYKIKKIDQEVDPYDVKPIIKKKQTNKSIEEDLKLLRNDPYMQLTENAKLIAAQRSSRWKPRSGSKKESFKPDHDGGYEGKSEEKSNQLGGAGEGKDAEQKYRMMTFKIRSKQDMGQVVPVGNFEAVGERPKRPGDKEEKPMQAVNMYKPDVEPKEVKHPTVEPSQPSEGPGFLSRLNPLSWFRHNPQTNMVQEEEVVEKKIKPVTKQYKPKYEVAERSGRGEDATAVGQPHRENGSSVDVVTQPCGLATGESDDSWKSEYERLKKEKREKLKMIQGNMKKGGHNKPAISLCDNSKDKYDHKMKRPSTLGNSSSNNASKSHNTAKSHNAAKKRTFSPRKLNSNNNSSTLDEERPGEGQITHAETIAPRIDHLVMRDGNNNNSKIEVKSLKREDVTTPKQRLEKSASDAVVLQAAINTYMRWYFLSLAVIVLVALGALCPCLFTDLFACPVPSICLAIRGYLMFPINKVFGSTETSSVLPAAVSDAVSSSTSWMPDLSQMVPQVVKNYVTMAVDYISQVGWLSFYPRNFDPLTGDGPQVSGGPDNSDLQEEESKNIERLRKAKPFFQLYLGWEERQEYDLTTLQKLWHYMLNLFAWTLGKRLFDVLIDQIGQHFLIMCDLDPYLDA